LNPITRKIFYGRDVVFKKVENTSRLNEYESTIKGLEKMEFELKNEGSD